jgi:hypothetical protein
MTKPSLIPTDEYDFCAQPDNQMPQGPPRQRRTRLSDAIPVRFPPNLVEEIRRGATEDDRSISSWIRRAVQTRVAAPSLTRPTPQMPTAHNAGTQRRFKTTRHGASVST